MECVVRLGRASIGAYKSAFTGNGNPRNVELPKLLRSTLGVMIETIGFDDDHLHMVMTIPPKYAIAAVMGKMKSQSSHPMRKTFGWLAKVYWKENVVWSPGYFVSSVAIDEDVIRHYVEYQGRKDSDQLRMEL